MNHKQGYSKIAIEINRICNHACINCDRFCNMPEMGLMFDEDFNMTMDQIKKFISEIIEKDIILDRISILGGEPLLHPKFSKIINVLHRELVLSGRARNLSTNTNNILPFPTSCKNKTNIVISNFQHKKNTHWCSRVASQDIYDDHLKYCMKCNRIEDCGIVLNKKGFFPCVISSSLVFFFNIEDVILKRLPRTIEEFSNFYSKLSKYCFLAVPKNKRPREIIHGNFISKTFLNNMNKKKNLKTYSDY